MGLNKLELDFTKGSNTITLIVGNNGTGKTGGILSNIHPYSGLGHLEARDDSDIIIPKKDGHKVAIFTTKKHEYYVEHFYKWQGDKKGRKISSYIKKDGKELNPAGTVTSFTTIVESEFQIDPNFLKLLRLGPNVKNFIGLGATERKAFISKLLSDVDIYLKDQKIAADKCNLLNNTLKIALDKKKRLGVEDITFLRDSIDLMNDKLNALKENKENLIKEFFKYKGEVNVMDIDEYNRIYSDTDSTISEIHKELSSLTKPKYDHDCSLEQYNSIRTGIMDQKLQYVSESAKLNTSILQIKDKLVEITNMLSDVKDDEEESDIIERINELESHIAEYETSDYSKREIPSITKSDLESDLDKINMILFHYNAILDLPNYSLDYFFKVLAKGKEIDDLDRYYINRMSKLKDKLLSIDKKKNLDLPLVMYVPSECKCFKECSYYKVIAGSKNNKNVEIAEINEEIECLEGLNIIKGNLNNIRQILSMRKEIKEYNITFDNIIEALYYKDKSKIIKLEVIDNLMESLDAYLEYDKNKARLSDEKKNLELLKSKHNNISIDELTKKEANLNIDLNNLNDRLSSLDNSIKDCNEKLTLIDEKIADYNISQIYSVKLSELNTKLELYEEKLKDISIMGDKIHNFLIEKSRYESNLEIMNNDIKKLEDEIYHMKLKETTFIQLTEEINHVKALYDYSEYIREAVSSKTGIPKIHVAFYCRALKATANEIIKEIYDGELIIRDFNITDSKFEIPYYTKGANISDIRYGSQAEVSVTTVALSFAILMQFMPKYNIVLLDEIDGPLHQTNKERLFASLEGQLKSIGCEQVFLITQSNMFNDYPVNIISTDREYSKMITNNKNIIFQK